MNTFHSLCRPGGRLLLIAFLGLACIPQANATEAARVTATPSRTSLQVAEPFWFDVTVTAPAGARVIFPSTGDKLGDFDILDTRDLFDIPSAGVDDQRTWTRRLQLESIVTGELEIPSIEIQVARGMSPQAIRSQPVVVRIVSVLEERGDPMQFRDIQSVIDVDVPSKPSQAWIWWTVTSLSGLALAVAAVAIVARRKRWLTPSQWALAKLNELQRTMPAQDSDAAAKPLPAIMRNFLQLQFLPPEPGRTPDELLDALKANQCVDATTLKQLRELFALADEAKFAGRSLSSADLDAMFEQARWLVDRIANVTDSEISSPAPATTEAR